MDHPELSFRLRAVPAAVFVDLLREAREPLNARALKDRLTGRGVQRDVVDAAWRRAQPGVKRHANVAVDAAGAYCWGDVPVPVELPKLTPVEALDRILRGRLHSAMKAELGDLVRATLRDRDPLEQQARPPFESAREARTVPQRQIRIEAARSVAELAMELEDLVAAGRRRGGVDRPGTGAGEEFDLTPVGRAGDEIRFDPPAHTPIGGHLPDGAPATVVRPGYSWHIGVRDVLVGKAQVVRRSEMVPRGMRSHWPRNSRTRVSAWSRMRRRGGRRCCGSSVTRAGRSVGPPSSRS